MPYTTPNATDLKTYLPAFTDTPDATIDMYIAGAQVDTSWLEADYQPAVMLWAAWAMTDAGIGSGGELASARQNGVSRLKSGSLDVSFTDSASNAGGYDTNAYGRRFMSLYRKNKAGPRVIRGGVGCRSGWAKDWPLGTGGI